MTGDVQTFEKHRRELLALAYRMLGDLGRAEDAVQEAWLRWQGLEEDVDAPRAYLAKVVTRLCLNELQSGRSRREESRSDRLPEPIRVDEDDEGMLGYLGELGLKPGAQAVVVESAPFDGPLTIDIDSARRAISRDVARLVLVSA